MRGDDEHHGAAHFVFHAGDVHQVLRGLRLGDGTEDETGVCEFRKVGSQRAVVFCDVLTEEDSIACAFIVIVVHGEVGDGAGFIIDPILRALCGEGGMLDGKDEVSAGGEPVRDFLHEGGIIADVVQGEGRQDDIDALCGKGEVFHGDALVGDVGKGMLFLRNGEHFLGDVDAEDAFCTLLGCVGTMPAIATAEVEHAAVGEVGQELLQSGPLACAVKTVLRAGHLGVLVEEFGVVVAVLFHSGLCVVCWGERGCRIALAVLVGPISRLRVTASP